MASKFAFDMQQWVDKAKVKPVTYVKEFTQDIAKAVVENTPVWTGFLRGSWFATLNDPDAGYEGAIDPSGGESIAKMAISINGTQLGDTIYILNSASYAHHVEFGTNRMEPRAFVRGTLSQANDIAARTANRIRSMR